METRITQCPRCGTSFRVTDALLAVAAGAVRCGSCLHIFNARENWLDDKVAEEKKATETAARTGKVDRAAQLASNPATKPERRDPVIDEDALFDDDTPLFDDEGDDSDSGNRSIYNPGDADFAPAESEGNSAYDNFLDDTEWLTPNKISFDEPVADSEASHDDDWAENLLRDDAPPTPAPDLTPAAATDALSDADRQIARISIISDYQLEHDDILAQVPETAERTESEDIILDLPSALDPGLRDAPPADASESADVGTEPADENFNAGDRIGGEPGLAALRGLNTEPIRLHQFVREKRWPKVLWGLGFVIAAAALPAQYLYFNFNNLAHGELRPWLAQACDLIGCQLPAQSDPAHIRTGSLIVRSHPSVRGALAVDAIITNLAPFAQPYPELVLQFTDINGGAVAGRRFKPDEYLGGELTGSRLMPIGQPIHVGLEVRDPGPRAVNYLLSVSPPLP